MTSIKARNMQDLTPAMMKAFEEHEYPRPSRNGNVYRLPGITTVELTHPHERVCFVPGRDANPFFHLMEALCMLAGVNSNSLLSFLATNMDNFSDDGISYNAFYGTRARVTWGDQLAQVVRILKADPESRQAVVNLCDPADLLRDTKDKACNLCMIFNLEAGVLHMTTFNRSNDGVWGFVTGANMVHFPFFHEYVALMVGASMGSWFHASANMHRYDWNAKWDQMKVLPQVEDPYRSGQVGCMWLMSGENERATFDLELRLFIDQCAGAASLLHDGHGKMLELDTVVAWTVVPRANAPQFLKQVAAPLFNAYMTYRAGRHLKVENKAIMDEVTDYLVCPFTQETDWSLAALQWFNKRLVP